MEKSQQKDITIPIEKITNLILVIRGQKVILDADLAMLYKISTKQLNQAIKRNFNRFPLDFMFQLSDFEKEDLVTNCDRFNRLKHSTSLPYVFTEHGALMAATILNSPLAVEMSLLIVRTFIQLRTMFKTQEEIIIHLKDLERDYNANFKEIFQILDGLQNDPPDPNKLPIGFTVP